MGHLPLALENPGRVLFGFNGATTISLGYVVLPVQAGPITLNVRFSVVEDLSPFNTIMRHTWIHNMKVIPSTYHRMVSYLIEDGQIDLFGNKLVVRQYYQVALGSGHSTNNEPRLEPSNADEKKKLLNPVEGDPPTVDPLQPVRLSCNINQVTYDNSLIVSDELKLLESVLQQKKDVFS